MRLHGEPHSVEKVQQVMQLAEAMGERGAWSGDLIVWLCRGYIEVSLARDALGEKLLASMGDNGNT